jgi:RimJ/RimL family protein N-acetyltransferase
MAVWDGAVVLRTPRLLLRTFRRDDLPLYAALNADPEVVQYLGGVPLTRQHSDEIAEWAQDCFAETGLGLLAVERRADTAFLGMCGLHRQQSYPDDVEVGWRLAREHWGRGYATEAATGWLDHAFGPLGMPRVISITEVEDDGVMFQAVVYSITLEQWRRRAQPA